MDDRNDRVLEWAINEAAQKYRDDVAILAVYGSYVNGTSGPNSDVDFFFVPKSERGLRMSRTFIIQDVGYDLFPVSWGRLEGFAMFREPLSPLLGDSLVAFNSAEEDLVRFLALRARFLENLSDRGFMHARALDAMRKSEPLLRGVLSAGGIRRCRFYGGRLLMALADAVAYENGTYFHKGLKRQYDDLSAMRALPEGFLSLYDSVIKARCIDGIREAALSIYGACAGSFGCPAEPSLHQYGGATGNAEDGPSFEVRGSEPFHADYGALVSFYEEAKSSFNKIYRACSGEVRDFRLAFIASVCLQGALDEDAVSPGIDLLSGFDHELLDAHARAVREDEAKLVSYISAGAAITNYPDVDSFLASEGG